jgi:hypothetical protein
MAWIYVAISIIPLIILGKGTKENLPLKGADDDNRLFFLATRMFIRLEEKIRTG